MGDKKVSNKLKMKSFCLQYFVIYIFTAIVCSQYIPYLSSIGYNAFERGVIVAVYQIVAIFIQFICGYFCDKYGWFRRLFGIVTAITAVATAALFTFTQKIFILQLLLMVMSGSFNQSLFTLADNLLFAFNGGRENFSFIRSMGSIGWSVGSLIIAKILEIGGFGGVSVFVLLTGVLTLAVTYIFIPAPQIDTSNAKSSGIKMSDCVKLIKNERYVLTVITLFLVYMTSVSVSYALIDKILLLGGNTTHVAYRAAIHGIVEIPFYIFGAKISKKFGYNNLLTFCAVTFTLQFITYIIAGSANLLVILTVWQAVTGTSYMLAARNLLYEYADDDIKSTGLMLGSSLHMGIGSVLMPVVGGFITENVGVNVTLAIAAASSALGIVTSIMLKRADAKYRKSDD